MENFYKTKDILIDLKNHIENKESFSLVRLGDGGIKLINAIFHNEIKELLVICEKEGIPISKSREILDLWKISINMADYVDTPIIYYDGSFWPRIRKNGKEMHKKTVERLLSWEQSYNEAGFQISKYCNPEVNFLMCLNMFGNLNLLNILKDKRICLITSCDIKENILNDYDIDILKISGFYKNQFANCFEKVVTSINEDATKYDIWLVAAGELGRIYPGLIKYRGGIAVDVGSLIDYWCTGEIPVRLETFMKPHNTNKLKLDLTYEGNKFKLNI